MAFSTTVEHGVVTPSGAVRVTKSYSSVEALIEHDLSIPDSTTDQQVVLSIDVSALDYFYIHSDQAITVETNDSGSPDDTLVLTADDPYLWTSDSYHTFLLDTADITALYLTNASGSTATVKIRAGQDSTP